MPQIANATPPGLTKAPIRRLNIPSFIYFHMNTHGWTAAHCPEGQDRKYWVACPSGLAGWAFANASFSCQNLRHLLFRMSSTKTTSCQLILTSNANKWNKFHTYISHTHMCVHRGTANSSNMQQKQSTGRAAKWNVRENQTISPIELLSR